MDDTPTKKGRNDTTVFALAASPTSSPRRSSRIKKPAPITPRRFNRFFTPRATKAQHQHQRKHGANGSRKALRDISKAAFNTRQSDTHSSNSHPRKRRKLSFSSPSFSIPSSPTRHVGFLSSSQELGPEPETEEEGQEDLRALDNDSEATTDIEEDTMPNYAKVEQFSNRGTSAGVLFKRLGGRPRPLALQDKRLWLHETANFYTSLADKQLRRYGRQPTHHILPFSVTSCNTNSLIAVGDEEGRVRLIDSANEFSSGFHLPHLIFKPHDNAIMDLSFSEDDSLLATASGDQTCHVIDVMAQKSRYSLTGHFASVKRIQFQPGNPHVLATCARDGNITMWDTRQNPIDLPPQTVRTEIASDIRGIGPDYTIESAHESKLQLRKSSFGRSDFSVTSLAFVNPASPHLFVTTSENDSVVKLWDIRSGHSFRNRAVPVSSSTEPKSHQIHRRFGITSLAVSTDASTLYTLCRDHTIYAYSTSHLILGSAPEVAPTSKPFKPNKDIIPDGNPGLGPMYGFRHPALAVSTFYPKLSIRKATDSRPELLAAGSSYDCPVLFATHPRYLNHRARQPPVYRPPGPAPSRYPVVTRTTRHRATRLDSQSQSAGLNFNFRRNSFAAAASPTSQSTIDPASPSTKATRGPPSHPNRDTLPIYYHGTPLVRGHTKEVTGVAWSTEGNLVSISDDFSVRCWRENGEWAASRLRTWTGGETERKDWGWAYVEPGWDDTD